MSSMLESAQLMLQRAAKKTGISTTKFQQLLEPNHVHVFDINVKGKIHKGYRVQHNDSRGPYKGGIRFHAEVDEQEVRALALLMSLKTAVSGIPMGGGKGGVAFNPQEHDEQHIEAVSRSYARQLVDHIGPQKDVPGPDIGTPPQVLDWMADEFEKLSGDTTKAAFTGKSVGKGGSLGREAATGRGGMIALREYFAAHNMDPKTITVAIQGVGNVGFWFAKLAEQELGVRVVAVSDSRRTLVVKDFEHNKDVLSLEEYAGHTKGLIEDLDSGRTTFLERDAIIGLPVDVLVFAALGDVVTEANSSAINANCILELANGPVSDEAYQKLAARNIDIIPDIVANAGGVIVSYLEWLQNLEGSTWSEVKVNKKLEQILSSAMQRVIELAQKEGVTLKEAAFVIALQELSR